MSKFRFPAISNGPFVNDIGPFWEYGIKLWPTWHSLYKNQRDDYDNSISLKKDEKTNMIKPVANAEYMKIKMVFHHPGVYMKDEIETDIFSLDEKPFGVGGDTDSFEIIANRQMRGFPIARNSDKIDENFVEENADYYVERNLIPFNKRIYKQEQERGNGLEGYFSMIRGEFQYLGFKRTITIHDGEVIKCDCGKPTAIFGKVKDHDYKICEEVGHNGYIFRRDDKWINPIKSPDSEDYAFVLTK